MIEFLHSGKSSDSRGGEMQILVPTVAPGTLLDHWQGIPRYKDRYELCTGFQKGLYGGWGARGDAEG